MSISISTAEPTLAHPVSQLCTQRQCDEPVYAELCAEIKEEKRYHRKYWEFAFIIQALKERGLLRPGMRGLGFGVGKEPLSALFAKYGVKIVATDLPVGDGQREIWDSTQQHASAKAELNLRGICPADEFEKLVDFRPVNMRDVPADLAGFDFTWSSCALEHIGGMDASINFIHQSLKCLKPGGVAVHTTEYNCSSNLLTSREGHMIIFRRRDIMKLASELIAQGHSISLNFNEGNQKLDVHYDEPPYATDNHLKLKIYYRSKALGFRYRFIATSMGLIITKSAK